MGWFARDCVTSIEIDASADDVWKILMEFEKYPDWNPFIPSIVGEAKEGAQLAIQLKSPPNANGNGGSGGMNIQPTVQTVDATKKEFSWLGKLGVSGVFDGHHQFRLEDKGGGKTVFHHWEYFHGFLVPVLWAMVGKDTKAGFEAMNQALKETAEEK